MSHKKLKLKNLVSRKFWFSELIGKRLDPDPDPGGQLNADPGGSGSETLVKRQAQGLVDRSVPFEDS